LCKQCAKWVFRGFIDGLRSEKGVKERAQRATILAVPAVENLHHGPYLYLYKKSGVAAGLSISL